MFRSDARWRGSAPRIAQPTQPLPNLCPTSEAAQALALPNLPNLLTGHAYVVLWLAGLSMFYMCAYRSGRLGRLGNVSHCNGFDCPTSCIKGWAGRAIGSSQAFGGGSARVLSSGCIYGLHGRKNAVVIGFELWCGLFGHGKSDLFGVFG